MHRPNAAKLTRLGGVEVLFARPPSNEETSDDNRTNRNHGILTFKLWKDSMEKLRLELKDPNRNVRLKTPHTKLVKISTSCHFSKSVASLFSDISIMFEIAKMSFCGIFGLVPWHASLSGLCGQTRHEQVQIAYTWKPH